MAAVQIFPICLKYILTITLIYKLNLKLAIYMNIYSVIITVLLGRNILGSFNLKQYDSAHRHPRNKLMPE